MSAVVHDCVGAILVRDSRVLLGRRAADRDWLPGAWDVIGGHRAPGEDALGALRRELREEIGVAPLAWRALAVLEDVAPSPSWRLALFAVTAWTGTPRNLSRAEHDALQWCTAAEAQSRLRAAHPDFAAAITAALAPPAP